MADARDRQRYPLCPSWRHSVTHVAGLFPSSADGLWLVRGWARRGVWQTMNHHPVMLDPERVGRAASPIAVVIDSQSVKTTEAGGPRGYDAGKEVLGCTAMVDTDGRALLLQVHPTSVQDRDGAIHLLQASRSRFLFVKHARAVRALGDASAAMVPRQDPPIKRIN